MPQSWDGDIAIEPGYRPDASDALPPWKRPRYVVASGKWPTDDEPGAYHPWAPENSLLVLLSDDEAVSGTLYVRGPVGWLPVKGFE